MIIILILLSLVTFLYFYLTWDYDYFEKRGIPYKKPEILFGNYKDALFGIKHFGVMVQDLYEQFPNAAYIGFFKGRFPAIIVRDPELVKMVLIKDFNSFSENDFKADPKLDLLMSNNPFVLTGEAWKSIRSQWSLLMTSNKLKKVFENNIQNRISMRNYIKSHLGEQINSKVISLKFLANTIISSVFGLEANCFINENDLFVNISQQLFTSSTSTRIKILLAVLAPELSGLLNIRLVDKDINDKIVNLAREILEKSDENNIFIRKEEFQMNASKETQSDAIEKVAIRLFGFILDGIETTSTPLCMCLYLIAQYKHVQAKLRKEIDDVYEKSSSFSYENVTELTYMTQIINETLRMFPIVATHQRVCTKSVSLPPAVPGGKSFTIEKGMTAIVPVYAIHNDPQYYDNPENFDPERFNEINKSDKSNILHIPFGEGPRICIGSRLGLLNIKLAIAELVHNFEIDTCPESAKIQLDIDPSSFVVRPTKQLNIIFKERK